MPNAGAQPSGCAACFLAGIGYAIPGTVLALALLLTGAPWQLAPLLLLLWGYSDRFLAVARAAWMPPWNGSVPTWMKPPQAGLQLAAGVAESPSAVAARSMIVGLLLVFVDTVKELPLTFALRPFDFDTLSVRVISTPAMSGQRRCAGFDDPGLGLVAAIALVRARSGPRAGLTVAALNRHHPRAGGRPGAWAGQLDPSGTVRSCWKTPPSRSTSSWA
ncbi:MAG: hypothetical protein CM15mP77_3730 [Synechococcus sp.]|nr:MAG: hypothetical protein CM15mP77_3730 [Synechococcus sp.]